MTQKSPLIPSVAGYFTPGGFRHAIVATTGGKLHEIFFNPTLGKGNARLACFDAINRIGGFFTSDDGYQHEIVATPDGNVHEIYFKPNDIHFTQPPLARFNGIVDIAAFYAEDDHNRIVIVATADGNVTEIFYRPAIGVHVSQPPLARFNGIVGIAAFYTPDDKFRHVIVATDDGSVTEVFYHPTIGVHVSQPPLDRFSHRLPALEDISPDPTNVDAPTAAGLAFTSSSGRVVGFAGGPDALYATTEKSGVWKSANGAPWTQLATSPAEHTLAGAQIAVEPGNNNHAVTGNIRGAWESVDGGTIWNYIFDPNTRGCGDQRVAAVAFGPNGSLVLGTTCGIATRAPTANAFTFVNTPNEVRAFAVSETKIWARTDRTLLVSPDNGQSWSSPIPVPNGIDFDDFATFSLAAFDAFAYMVFSTPGVPQPPPFGTCGADVKLLVFNAANATSNPWTVQNVDLGGGHVCDGTGLGGRKFVRSFVRGDANLPMTLGQRLQLFCGVGQGLFQAHGLNGDGTVSSWSQTAATPESGDPNPDVHADIWDCNIDTIVGGRTAWIACDGGVSTNKLVAPYQFPGGGWLLSANGMHTHQIHTLTVLPTTPVGRSRLAYPTSDNEAWCRDSTPVVLPASNWQAVGAGGDVNFTVGDAGLPRFALLARHRALGTLKHFGGNDVFGITLLNWKLQRLSPTEVILLPTFGPDGPTTFQFIQAPKGAGSATLDAVMLVDLPLTFWDGNNNVPFNAQSPLGQTSNGLPVLIRNHNFGANPDINTSKGNGWSVELGAFPAGTQGFYVSGTPAAPVYYAFGDGGGGLALSKWHGNGWSTLGVAGLMSSPAFGPAFVNPFDQGVLYVITGTGIQVSATGGANFTIDQGLTALIKGTQGLPMNTLAHMAFNYDNPHEVAAVTVGGGVFFNQGDGMWSDLTGLMPTPRSPLVAVGIDCESIYVATDGRSLVRITDYMTA